MGEIKVAPSGEELAPCSPLGLGVPLQPSLPLPPRASLVTHPYIPEGEKEILETRELPPLLWMPALASNRGTAWHR